MRDQAYPSPTLANTNVITDWPTPPSRPEPTTKAKNARAETKTNTKPRDARRIDPVTVGARPGAPPRRSRADCRNGARGSWSAGLPLGGSRVGTAAYGAAPGPRERAAPALGSNLSTLGSRRPG
jgi:hypothetical protein